jgi:hypothetical protein
MTLPNSQIHCSTIAVIDAHVYATQRRHSVLNHVEKEKSEGARCIHMAMWNSSQTERRRRAVSCPLSEGIGQRHCVSTNLCRLRVGSDENLDDVNDDVTVVIFPIVFR